MRNNPERAITTLRNKEELSIKSLDLTLKNYRTKVHPNKIFYNELACYQTFDRYFEQFLIGCSIFGKKKGARAPFSFNKTVRFIQ
jgi:hypothetical protein